MNALPILLLGGAALLMMGGKKKTGNGVSGLPKIPPIDPLKLGLTKSYNPKTGSSSGYPKVSRDQMVEIQNKLVALGFSVGPKGPDGLYGPATEDAVEAFQKKYMTKAQGWDGKPGPTTRGVLDEEYNALSASKKAAAEQAIVEDKAEQKSAKAPVIQISTDGYFANFVSNPKTSRILLITTTGKPRLGPLFEDKTVSDAAKHNGAVFDWLLDSAAVGNAGKVLFGRVDLSTYQGNGPFQFRVNGRGYPSYFPMMVGIMPGGKLHGFLMPTTGAQTGIKKMTLKMQELIEKVLAGGAATS